MQEGLTCDLRDLGIQIIALPSREQVTMLSWVNLEAESINRDIKIVKKREKNDYVTSKYE